MTERICGQCKFFVEDTGCVWAKLNFELGDKIPWWFENDSLVNDLIESDEDATECAVFEE